MLLRKPASRTTLAQRLRNTSPQLRIAAYTAPIGGVIVHYVIEAVEVGDPDRGFTHLQAVLGWLAGAAVVIAFVLLSARLRATQAYARSLEKRLKALESRAKQDDAEKHLLAARDLVMAQLDAPESTNVHPLKRRGCAPRTRNDPLARQREDH